MHKILVFDLDRTLCPVGGPTEYRNVLLLRELERQGHTIVVCSGKPVYYLCGYLRQLGLKSPVMIGETGAVLQYGIDLPPEREYIFPCSERSIGQLKALEQEIRTTMGDEVWFQPNLVEVTPFFRTDTACDKITAILQSGKLSLDEINIYQQPDCYDFVPKNISKADMLAVLAQQMGTTAGDFIAIGDGINDISMFDYADVSIVIGDLDYPSDYRFSTLDDVLDFLILDAER